MLASAHSEDLTAYNTSHPPLPRIIVLLDGFGGFLSMFLGSSAMGSMAVATPLEAWAEMFNDLVVEGRQVGIHAVITADRRNAVPSRLHSSVSNRLLLRHADEGGYTEHGVPTMRARGLDLSAGRGLWQAESIVQIASVSLDPVGKSQGETIEQLAQSLPVAGPSAVASAPLPDLLTLSDLSAASVGRASQPLTFPLGLLDLSGEVAEIDLTWSSMVVAGAARSGRSTTLATCAAGLGNQHQVWGVGPASSSIDRTLLNEGEFGRAEAIVPLLERLCNLLDAGPSEARHVLLLDDVDTFDDMSLNPLWERLAKYDDLRVIASLETRSLAGYTTNPLLTALRRARRMVILQPDDATEILQATGVKAPLRPGQRMVPGRGIVIADRAPAVLQVAMP